MTDVITPINARIRAAVARSVLDILREVGRINFGDARVGETVEDSMVISAILIGQSEARLMCASDISEYVGLPRATVVRKLKEVAGHRDIGSVMIGRRKCYFLKDLNNPEMMGSLAAVLSHIRKLCAELSKLDT